MLLVVDVTACDRDSSKAHSEAIVHWIEAVEILLQFKRNVVFLEHTSNRLGWSTTMTNGSLTRIRTLSFIIWLCGTCNDVENAVTNDGKHEYNKYKGIIVPQRHIFKNNDAACDPNQLLLTASYGIFRNLQGWLEGRSGRKVCRGGMEENMRRR